MPKILLVEDNEMNRDLLSRRLSRRGYLILFALDGADGVARCAAELPDLVIMDLALPGMDGWEATRRIKAAPATRHIPVLALTAHALAGEEERARAAGCDDFETKPVDLPRLLGKLEALLKARRSTPRRTPQAPKPDAGNQARRLNLPENPEARRTIRHDLRTPANAIIGYPELVLEECGASAPPAFRQGLQRLCELGRELLESTNQVFGDAPCPLRELPCDELLTHCVAPADAALTLIADLVPQAAKARLPQAQLDLERTAQAIQKWRARFTELVVQHSATAE